LLDILTAVAAELNIMVTATCVSLWPQVSVWVIGAVNLAMLIIYLLLWSRIINPGARLLLFKHFGEGIAKGMLVTFQHLIKKTVTTQYPEQRLNTSRRIRGTELAWSKQNCTACRQCEKACPHGCITIETNESRQVTVFRLDGGRCIYCGLCVESCRFNALFMGRGYERTSYLLADLTLDKEQLAVDEVIKPSAYFHPELEESLKEQTLLINGEYKA
jgi:formate hydrogenlyase subunit 6/NADH:ubiquinone oxidoreductase subunit I